MPDKRKNRGAHPADLQLFAPGEQSKLQTATQHYSWLLTHGYAELSSLKLVGDRFALIDRQRLAVRRCGCSDQALRTRQSTQVANGEIPEAMEIDAFNLITSIEAALAGGVVLKGRDHCLRDMASMHGTYRSVIQTEPALQLIAATLAELKVKRCHWFLDRPVSNSGRLSQLIEAIGQQNRLDWATSLVDCPDPILKVSQSVVVTADSAILDACRRWFDLASAVLDRITSKVFLVDLSGRSLENE
jgi:hypothetical protein